MPTIDATVGGASANSFVTQQEADDYCDARLNADAWLDASDDDEKRALIEATREISALPFVGDRASATQSLSWPRAWAPNPDIPTLLFDPVTFIAIGPMPVAYFGTDVIPQRVKDATFELALQFIKAGTTDLAAIDPSISIVRERTDVLETEYAQPQQRAQGMGRFPRIVARLGPLLNAAQIGMTVVRS